MVGIFMKNIVNVMLLFLVLFIAAGSVNGANISDSIPTAGYSGMDPSNGTGSFEFRCNVDGAGVFLNDTRVGSITNGSLIVPVPVYDHPVKRQLRMEAPGYSVYNETLLNGPKVGETLIIRGKLQVLPYNLTGSVSLAVSPPGGQVSIDNTIVGIVPQSGILSLRTVKAGNRTVTVTMAGYKEYTESVYIDANMEKKVRITLSPVTTGTLQISSSPAGAQVIINGSSYGTTPVTVPDLEQGSYTIGFTMPGYQPYQSQVVLTPGQTIPVSGALQPVPTPTTPPATPEPTATPTPTQAGLPVGLVIGGLLGVLALNHRKNN